MFGRGFPTQRKGEAIRASTINAGLRAASGLLKLRAGPGLGVKWLGDTPVIELLETLGASIGKAPSGIPGRSGDTLGTGTVAIWEPDASGGLAPSGRSVQGANLAAESVAADAYLILLKVGAWRLVIWEECPEAEPEEPEE